MNIQPTPGIASLAGTARAQARGTDPDRRSPSSDAAADPRLGAVSDIEAGANADDRDADGRQLLERREDPKPNSDSSDDGSSEADDANGEADGQGPSPTSDGSTTHIDFQA